MKAKYSLAFLGMLALIGVTAIIGQPTLAAQAADSATQPNQSNQSADMDPKPYNEVTVKILHIKGFNPQTVTLHRGDEVLWINRDVVNHEVVADDGSFDSGLLRPGQTYEHTFNYTGIFTYRSTLDPSMTGTIIVR